MKTQKKRSSAFRIIAPKARYGFSLSPLFSSRVKLLSFRKLWQIQFTTAKGILGFTRAARQDLSESRDWSEKSALNI